MWVLAMKALGAVSFDMFAVRVNVKYNTFTYFTCKHLFFNVERMGYNYKT